MIMCRVGGSRENNTTV